MERLAKKVKELRRKMGWGQEDMAREIGVSLSTVQRWERQGWRAHSPRPPRAKEALQRGRN
ncbi:MAG: hypothetical protein COS88_00435 [Chloroflexi bacterium CG07_land_8_20_14_0_80_51_10]|nr:MAG: hypothetical protein COS88_00435 [Chloroflexi bacterium CG07_land_8_20_14_0_80_51_10]